MTDPHAAKPAEPAHAGMTTKELCQAVGVGQSALQMWLQSGFLQAENIGIPGGGKRRMFAPGQLERARLVKALLHGHELRACRDAHGGDRRGGAGETPVLGCRSGRDPHGHYRMNQRQGRTHR
jgi:DNA-binding transcriptional MerR regulator